MKTLRSIVFIALAALALATPVAAQNNSGPIVIDIPAAPTVTSLFGSLGPLINPDTPIPQHLFGAGVGVQQGSTLNGALRVCVTKGLNMACAVTRYSGGTSAGSAEGDQILLAQHGFLLSIHGQLGVAVGADGSKGGAFDVGAALHYNVSRLPPLRTYKGYWASITFDWDKRDVNDFISQSGTLQGFESALKPFASKTSVTFWLHKEF